MRRSIFSLWLALSVGAEAWASGRDVAKARALIEEGLYSEAEVQIQQALRKKQDVETVNELRALLDDARYQAALKIGTIDALDAYLLSAPPSANANSAALQICEMRWSAAEDRSRETDDPAPLLAFRDQNPSCQQADAAWQIAGRIDMARAQRVGTAEALREAIARWSGHPGLAALVAQEERAHEVEARSTGTPEALLAFLDEHPESAAQVELRGLVEASYWRRAVEATDAGPVQSYLEIYPNGPHKAEARALLYQRASGLMSKQGDDWGPLPEVWSGAATLVYKAPQGVEAHAPELVLLGLHRLSDGGVAPSPVLDPRTVWAHQRLQLTGDPDQPLRIGGRGPGAAGEWVFDVNLDIDTWSWRGATLAGVRLQVVDRGRNLVTMDVGTESRPDDLDVRLLDQVALPKVLPEGADGLRRLEAAVRDYLAGSPAWRAQVAGAAGLVGTPAITQGDRLAASPLLVTWGSSAAPPGSPNNAIVPLILESSSRSTVLRGVANKGGVLTLAGGRAVGSVRFDGTAGMACGTFGLRAQPSVASGVSASTLLSSWLYVVGVDSSGRAAALPFDRALVRWPSLAEVAGPKPASWLRDQLAASATSPVPVVGLPDGAALDLNADGLPDWIRALGDHLVIVHMDALGRLHVKDTPLASGVQVELIVDLDADGLPEIVTRRTEEETTRFQVYSTRQQRVGTTVLRCGA